jgi:CDP-diacylglycerol--glycerol-3-phosphate 3-phosphatidyltransferase
MGFSTVGLEGDNARESSLLPRSIVARALAFLDSVALRLVALGVTANAITLASLALAGTAAVLLGAGQLGWAAPVIAVASIGDALDGLVARRSGTASVGGALLDASVDRYEEILLLGGLAVLFRDSVAELVLTLAALGGSFMISYGSAKAEAFGRRVPPGVLRRAERAMLLFVGVAVTPPFAAFARGHGLPRWGGYAPVLAAMAVLAVVGNVSAVLRLRKIGAV